MCNSEVELLTACMCECQRGMEGEACRSSAETREERGDRRGDEKV